MRTSSTRTAALDATVVLGVIGLLVEEHITSPRGNLLLTLLILWPPVAAYLMLTQRIPHAGSWRLACAIAAGGLLALVLSGASMAAHRPVSLFAAASSAALWGAVAYRRRRDRATQDR